jgi:hypothetical protein
MDYASHSLKSSELPPQAIYHSRCTIEATSACILFVILAPSPKLHPGLIDFLDLQYSLHLFYADHSNWYCMYPVPRIGNALLAPPTGRGKLRALLAGTVSGRYGGGDGPERELGKILRYANDKQNCKVSNCACTIQVHQGGDAVGSATGLQTASGHARTKTRTARLR